MVAAVMRFYVVTFGKSPDMARMGTLSAVDALDTIRSMKREGWSMTLIKQGTQAISLTELQIEAAREMRADHLSGITRQL